MCRAGAVLTAPGRGTFTGEAVVGAAGTHPRVLTRPLGQTSVTDLTARVRVCRTWQKDIYTFFRPI